MKLTNKAWIFLGIGILAIVLLSLGLIYIRQEHKHAQLSNKISTVNVVLPKLIAESEQLERQLNQLENELVQAELSLHDARSRFPERDESIDYGEALFQIADSHHLTLTSITSSERTSTSIEGAKFLITRFVVNLEGELQSLETAGNYDTYVNQTIGHILAFVHEIATIDYFSGTRIELVDVKVPISSKEEGGIEPELYTGPSAAVNITIYRYQDE